MQGENRERAEMQEDEEGGPLARMRRGKERMLAALWPTSTIPLHLEFPGLRVTPGTALATLYLLHPAQQAHLVLGFFCHSYSMSHNSISSALGWSRGALRH